MPRATLLQPINALERASRYLAVAIGLGTTLAIAAIFWHQRARESRRLVHQYRRLAGEIARRGALLRAIVGNSSDLILARDAQTGATRFFNPALADAMGIATETAIDNDDSLAEELSEPLERLAGTTETAGDTLPAAIDIGGRKRWLHVHHHLVDGDHTPEPLAAAMQTLRFQSAQNGRVRLTIARDVSDLVEAQERQRRIVDQTITALTRAIELGDPYLDGQSARMRHLAVRLGEELGMDRDARRTLDQAAALSQIGKLFLPQAILTKKGRHTQAETAIMREHINHTLRLIEPIEFELPVARALAAMHERLDGEGYPHGLHGEEICLESRVLAVADLFCARISPRSYRNALSAEEVCQILVGLPERYDARVVGALSKLVADGDIIKEIAPRAHVPGRPTRAGKPNTKKA